MSQDRESGARANRFGREMAPRIATLFGGHQPYKNINLFQIDGQWITIRSSRIKTRRVGVLNSVEKQIDSVWAAFEFEPSLFEIFRMPRDIWAVKAHKASKNVNQKQMSMTVFKKFDRALGVTVRLETDGSLTRL